MSRPIFSSSMAFAMELEKIGRDILGGLVDRHAGIGDYRQYGSWGALEFVKDKASNLGISQEMLRRGVNVGFSGGEKKRNEILQMAMLQPSIAILDETDSGLDIDALKVVSDGVNALRSPDRSMIVITHYQRLLNYIVPDVVHVLSKGRVVKTGGKELALELEAHGYAEYRDAAA